MALGLRREARARKGALARRAPRGYHQAMNSEAVPPSWREVLEPVLAQPQLRQLGGWLRAEEAAGKRIYPPRGQRLRALDLTPLEAVKVVILGQDPYHGPGQAMGLAFSVPTGVRLPPSLRNIFTELCSDLDGPRPGSGDLRPWAQQGVLLLNTALTVEEGRAGSHAGKGWELVTDAVIAAVAERQVPCVFILWGNHARAKAQRIPALMNGCHGLIEGVHPSPLSASRGFFGSRPFSRANVLLEARGVAPVDWQLP
jgi:uracil-DNA glycosylase